jgi:protein ImuB
VRGWTEETDRDLLDLGREMAALGVRTLIHTDVERERPLWLLPVPRQLKTDHGWPCLQGRLKLQHSRERIESGWWDGQDIARDYFIAESASGSRYWIYRELDGQRRWFLQGLFE